MSYKIKIPLFEGPFDLLLFFIERDEIDIKDIPIATITKDFLDYIENLESMNIEVASEFIVVAATLMRIKSKMLLPRLMIDEDGNEVDTHKKKSQKKDENIVKKKRGRPKGSKNKNKKKDSNLPTLNSMSKAQIQELLDKKIKEKEEEMKGKDDVKDKDKVEMEEVEGEGEVEEDIIYKVDNVPYEIKDNEIMDPEDYSPIGQSDGKGGIIFEDEEAEEKHQENIKKYCK